MCDHCHEHHHHHEKESSPLLRAGSAVLILLLAICFDIPLMFKITCFILSYFIAGFDVLLNALKNLLRGKVFDENFLMGIATLGALAIGEFPEAVMVMVFYQVGEYFQHKAVEKSRKSITDLMDIRSDYANIEKDGQIVKVSPENLTIGDIIVVKSGEKIPLDGIVIEGTAVVDASALTGEAKPRKLQEGCEAVSGSINTNGVIKIRVTREFKESTVSKILEMVEHASSRKAKAENFITKFARYYTPVVVICAILLTLIPPLLTGGSFSVWFSRALTFLVISCPCALVISVPLSFFAGIGAASKNGILVKGSNYLEAIAKPYAVVFDKTGTLTKGNFAVTKIMPVNGISEAELLEFTAKAEHYSNHPIAISIRNAYSQSINSDEISNVEEIAGLGLKANVCGDEILAGSDRLMENFSVKYNKISEHGTIIYIAKNRIYLGYIVISDEIKEDSAAAIKQLKNLGVKTEMLTGDTSSSAEFIGEVLGIDAVYSQLLPADKVEKFDELFLDKNKKGSVIFAGDGINDAPVLTRADVGIAMGALGSDAALEAADVVIMDDKPSKVPLAVKIARGTMAIVKQNIIFAVGIKVLFLVLGAFGLVTMWGAVFADVGVALIAILNALRALNIKA